MFGSNHFTEYKQRKLFLFTECLNGEYGENCSGKCGQCRYSQPCNTLTGKCPKGCKDGYTGTYCNDSK